MSASYTPAATPATRFTLWDKTDARKPEHIDDGEDARALLDWILSVWNEEEEGPQYFTIEDANGDAAFIAWRSDLDDPTLATVFIGGSDDAEQYRCTYILDADGRYISTDVTRVEEPVVA